MIHLYTVVLLSLCTGTVFAAVDIAPNIGERAQHHEGSPTPQDLRLRSIPERLLKYANIALSIELRAAQRRLGVIGMSYFDSASALLYTVVGAEGRDYLVKAIELPNARLDPREGREFLRVFSDDPIQVTPENSVLLGEGEYGTAYRLTGFGGSFSNVVLKKLKPASSLQAFELEVAMNARAAANALAPPFLGAWRTRDGSCALVSKFAAGQSLNKLTPDLSNERQTRVLSDILVAIERAAEVGVKHMDLHDQNIFVDENSHDCPVTFIDWGLAFVVAEDVIEMELAKIGMFELLINKKIGFWFKGPNAYSLRSTVILPRMRAIKSQPHVFRFLLEKLLVAGSQKGLPMLPKRRMNAEESKIKSGENLQEVFALDAFLDRFSLVNNIQDYDKLILRAGTRNSELDGTELVFDTRQVQWTRADIVTWLDGLQQGLQQVNADLAQVVQQMVVEYGSTGESSGK